MTERPILFSGEMVRAILEGRKTMTRRVLKWQPIDIIPYPRYQIKLGNGDIKSCTVAWAALTTTEPETHGKMIRCRYGQPGDRLWVRETWRMSTNVTFNGEPFPMYKATYDDYYRLAWKPAIHMPRWASRITLEIMSVKVERVQDISLDDCENEGSEFLLSGIYNFPIKDEPPYRANFHRLWNSINAKRGYSWESNPWVWAIEFKKVEG